MTPRVSEKVSSAGSTKTPAPQALSIISFDDTQSPDPPDSGCRPERRLGYMKLILFYTRVPWNESQEQRGLYLCKSSGLTQYKSRNSALNQAGFLHDTRQRAAISEGHALP